MSAFTLPTTLDGWLTLLETRHAKPIDLGLERVGEVYRRLGIQLPGVKFVVAGTNGKGSTCAMLDAILRAAGYRVGLHTSPHLLRFNERIRIDGEELSDEALLPLFEQVELARGDVSLSYFEFTTLVMFLAFSREPLDAVVMEIGLGGRLDAVNLVDADCAIVTSVAIDHAQWLGNDRETIALEKAHIFRPDRPAICSDPQPPQSLVRHAEEIGADLWLLGRDYNYAGDRQQWAWTGRGTRRSGLAYPALRGMNQLLNASGVLRCRPCAASCRSVPRTSDVACRWSRCRDASRCCRGSPPSSWTWGITPMPPAIWWPIWATWPITRLPTQSSACCPTRISTA